MTKTTTPSALTHKAVFEWLISIGATEIIHVNALAELLRCSERTICDAIREKKLNCIGKRTLLLTEVVKWLIENPRRIVYAQSFK